MVLLLIFCAPLTAIGEDLLYFYTHARTFDANLKRSEYEHDASREILKQAYSKLLPEVSAYAQHVNTRDRIVSSDNTLFAKGTTYYPTDSYSVSLVQPLFDYSSFVGVSKAKKELLLSDARYDAERKKLVLHVAGAYFNVLAAQNNHHSFMAEAAAVREHFELVKGRYNMGLAPVTDFLDAKARMLSVNADVIASENMLDDAIQALYKISGQMGQNFADLSPEMVLARPEPASPEAWTEMALAQNLEVLAMKHGVEVAAKEVSRLKGDHYPVVTLEGRHSWDDTEGTAFGGGSEVRKEELIVNVSVPVFKGGNTNSRVRQAASLLQAEREQLREKELAVKREVRVSYLGVLSAMSRADALKQTVEAQKTAVEAKREGFDSGLNTSLMVMDAERDYHYAKRDYAAARYDYIIQMFRLEHAAGKLSDTDLTYINQFLEQS
ncbi:outer membrane protein TolC [Desulfoluna limicola]|uniref:Outer membrane protein TolC n=2 Tax=Desulfoluna limicola TaxID=2810562 RepID=A0ABM7PG94_9BACT|nr:outer membrane protein TolC [Desulfoluna limicola]